jgi:hypothetical protein
MKKAPIIPYAEYAKPTALRHSMRIDAHAKHKPARQNGKRSDRGKPSADARTNKFTFDYTKE